MNFSKQAFVVFFLFVSGCLATAQGGQIVKDEIATDGMGLEQALIDDDCSPYFLPEAMIRGHFIPWDLGHPSKVRAVDVTGCKEPTKDDIERYAEIHNEKRNIARLHGEVSYWRTKYDNLKKEFDEILGQRDEARKDRDKAQEERNGYRDQAEKAESRESEAKLNLKSDEEVIGNLTRTHHMDEGQFWALVAFAVVVVTCCLFLWLGIWPAGQMPSFKTGKDRGVIPGQARVTPAPAPTSTPALGHVGFFWLSKR